MRKIETELRKAIANKKPFSKQNTTFARVPNSETEWQLLLHGNLIALFDTSKKTYPIPTYVSFAGYPTKTTCSRLNALEKVHTNIKQGIPYVNDREVDADGWWSPCNLNY